VDLPEACGAGPDPADGENPARYQVRSIDVSKGYCLVVTDERHARITFPLDTSRRSLTAWRCCMRTWMKPSRDSDGKSARRAQCAGNLCAAPDPEADAATSMPSRAADAQVSPSPSPTPKKTPTAATKKPTIRRAIAVHKSPTPAHHLYPMVMRAIPVSTPVGQPF